MHYISIKNNSYINCLKKDLDKYVIDINKHLTYSKKYKH